MGHPCLRRSRFDFRGRGERSAWWVEGGEGRFGAKACFRTGGVGQRGRHLQCRPPCGPQLMGGGEEPDAENMVRAKDVEAAMKHLECAGYGIREEAEVQKTVSESPR
eukprot:GGOE01045014.1.p3 GENE.GGOE01045014.1~~GGOE01045014.1.p3  ORF type:complete len:107 (-),score=0.49 GGOE01045014.1:474-794(-)